jgi:hypothetical protein
LITRKVISVPGSAGMSQTTTLGLFVAFWKSKTTSRSSRTVRPKRIETELLGCPFTVMTLLDPELRDDRQCIAAAYDVEALGEVLGWVRACRGGGAEKQSQRRHECGANASAHCASFAGPPHLVPWRSTSRHALRRGSEGPCARLRRGAYRPRPACTAHRSGYSRSSAAAASCQVCGGFSTGREAARAR